MSGRSGPTPRLRLVLLALCLLVPLSLLPGARAQEPQVGCEDPGVICGTEGDDELIGTDADEVILGLGGNDVINTGGGNDRGEGGPGRDVVAGGPGDDVLDGDEGDDLLEGGDGEDVQHGGGDGDKLGGGKGNDQQNGGPGKDKVEGGTGNDKQNGGAGNDKVEGGKGNDKQNGGPGKDKCDGGAGNDAKKDCERPVGLDEVLKKLKGLIKEINRLIAKTAAGERATNHEVIRARHRKHSLLDDFPPVFGVVKADCAWRWLLVIDERLEDARREEQAGGPDAVEEKQKTVEAVSLRVGFLEECFAEAAKTNADAKKALDEDVQAIRQKVDRIKNQKISLAGANGRRELQAIHDLKKKLVARFGRVFDQDPTQLYEDLLALDLALERSFIPPDGNPKAQHPHLQDAKKEAESILRKLPK